MGQLSRTHKIANDMHSPESPTLTMVNAGHHVYHQCSPSQCVSLSHIISVGLKLDIGRSGSVFEKTVYVDSERILNILIYALVDSQLVTKTRDWTVCNRTLRAAGVQRGGECLCYPGLFNILEIWLVGKQSEQCSLKQAINVFAAIFDAEANYLSYRWLT